MENTAQPSVFVSSKGKRSFDLKDFIATKKIWIIAALVIILLIGGGIFLSNKLKVQSTTQTSTEDQPITGGELSLTSNITDYEGDPQSFAYNVGDTVSVTVKVDTAGFPTLGTDVVIKYDPNVLELGSEASLVSGNAYPEYPSKNFDQKNGIIAISGISALSGKEFSGLADFVTINFKAKAAGTTNINFDFTPGGTADSNIIKLGVENDPSVDILSKVSNLSVTIK